MNCRECRCVINIVSQLMAWYRDPMGSYWCPPCWIRYGFREFYVQGTGIFY